MWKYALSIFFCLGQERVWKGPGGKTFASSFTVQFMLLCTYVRRGPSRVPISVFLPVPHKLPLFLDMKGRNIYYRGATRDVVGWVCSPLLLRFSGEKKSVSDFFVSCSKLAGSKRLLAPCVAKILQHSSGREICFRHILYQGNSSFLTFQGESCLIRHSQ